MKKSEPATVPTRFYSGAEAAQRFQDFARAITAVPKSEIDKAAKKLPPQKVGAKRIKKPESK